MTFIFTTIIRSLIRRIPGVQLLTGVFVVIVAVGILLYLLYAGGLTQIAKNRSVRFPYLAWVPILNLYVLGACADDMSGKKRYAILCPVFTAVSCVLLLCAYVPVHDVFQAPLFLLIAGIALAITSAILFFVALNAVYASISRIPAALTVLSILFWVLIPIFLYTMRNNLPGGGKRVQIDRTGD